MVGNDDDGKFVTPIDLIEKTAKPLDLVVLALPTSVTVHGGSVGGTDYTSGFYEGVDGLDGKNYVVINRFQKSAFDSETKRFLFTEVSGFEVVRRYEPKDDDGIDEIIGAEIGGSND